MTEPPSEGEWPSAAGDLVFIGGTGRSGTHVLARLLDRHPRFAGVPIESRFHCNKRGMPDLLGGRVTLAAFVEKLRDFWWHRVRVDGQPRGLYNLLTRRQFDAAVERFEPAYPPDPVGACRRLFVELLWPLATEEGKPGLVEMSSHNVREAQTLRRLFPQARFVHTVRDGRDAASSVATKTWGPDSIVKGIDWWADRLRAIEAGVRGEEDGAAYALGPEQLFVVALDDLVWGDREARLRPVARLPGGGRRRGDARVLRRPDEPGRRARGALARGPGAGRPPPGAATVRARPGGARARGQPRRPPADRRVRAPWLTGSCSSPRTGPGLGHLTRSMAIARRLDPSLEPLVLTLSAAAPVVHELGFPVEYVASYGTPGAGSDWRWSRRLRGRLRAAIAEAAPTRGGVRRRAPLPGADRRSRGRSRHPLGLVPAADVAPGLQPGGAGAQRVLRRRARAGRACRRRGPRPDRGPPGRGPPRRADRLLRPTTSSWREPTPSASSASSRARSTSWSSWARAPRWPARWSGAWAISPGAGTSRSPRSPRRSPSSSRCPRGSCTCARPTR